MWAIALFGSLVVLAVFLLWVPLDFTLKASIREKSELKLKFSWLFGLVKSELPRARKEPAPDKKAPGPKKKRKRIFDPCFLFKIARTKGLTKNFLRLVKDVFRCLRFRELAADFRVGLGDPADTGMLFTVVGPAVALAGPYVFSRVNIEPCFEEEPLLEGYSYGSVRLRPIRLIPPVIRFVFSRPALRAAWVLVAAKVKH